VTAMAARFGELARRGQLASGQVRLASRKSCDQFGVVARVRGRGGGRMRFRHVIRETTSFDGRFPATYVA
ncbi:MAG TPA: hypothetical protein VGQ02_05285, partial [Candidatus Limnocylindrales bacterium]|nr:hypothetical protein [Candidatus Limnocylindrales bacterium]